MKTAFAIHGLGIFQYKRMSMGLVNSAATLCQLVEQAFDVDTEPEIFVYLDDFIICTESFDRHVELIKLVAKKLSEIGLKIGLKKSSFCMKRLKFLGHVIDNTGIIIDHSRTEAIRNIKRPLNIKQIRSFIGMASWYRKFIKDFVDLSSPLTDLIKKGSKFVWSDIHENSFQKLKQSLCDARFLAFPIPNVPFAIECNSSNIGVSAFLFQFVENEKKIISYMSAKLSEAQKRFHPIERSCLSVILALEKFRTYFQGSKVVVYSDNSSINWLQNCQDLGSILRAGWPDGHCGCKPTTSI